MTDETRLTSLQGATLRDGTPVGRRLSTVGFNFPSTTASNFLALSGLFAVNQKVAGTFTIFPDNATNPFKHRYHPDHDNLDTRFRDFKREAFEVQRTFEFELGPRPSGGPRPPDYGYARLAASRETVRGLQPGAVYARATFRLSRVVETAALD